MWQRTFGGSAGVIGRVIYLNERPFTIIGVATQNFKGVNAIFGPDLWVPSMMAEQVLPAQNRDALHNRSRALFTGAGRLRPGITMAQAEADLSRSRRRCGRSIRTRTPLARPRCCRYQMRRWGAIFGSNWFLAALFSQRS